MYSPTLESFVKLAAQGNLIPVTRRILPDFETPLSAYHKIRGQGESFLFESVEGGEHLGRYSFVGCNPRAVIRQVGSNLQLRQTGKVIEEFVASHLPPPTPATASDRSTFSDPVMKTYGMVEEFTMSVETPSDAPEENHPQTVRDGLEVVERVMKNYRPVTMPSLPRFTGGAVGFIGYE